MSKAILNGLAELPDLAYNWHYRLFLDDVEIQCADCLSFKNGKITFRFTVPTTGTHIPPSPSKVTIEHYTTGGEAFELIHFLARGPVKMIGYNTAPDGIEEPIDPPAPAPTFPATSLVVQSLPAKGPDKFVRHWYQVPVEWKKVTSAKAGK